MVDRERFVFSLSAWNELAGIDDHFTLFLYIRNDGRSEIEIVKRLAHERRRHLARIAFPLIPRDVRPGSKLVVFGRQYSVDGYDDKSTRDALATAQRSTVALLAEQGLQSLGRVWAGAEACGLRIVSARLVSLSFEDAAAASQHLAAGTLLKNGSTLALALQGEDAAEKLRSLIAHLEDVISANALFASAGTTEADDFLSSAFFGPLSARLSSARANIASSLPNSSVFLVLPHVVIGSGAGSLLCDLESVLKSASSREDTISITGVRILDLTRTQAEEFLEIYKGVVPEYTDLVNEYTAGPLIALEVTGHDSVNRMRRIAGPRDVDVARRIAPDSLRARHGVPSSAGASSRGKLAVHVTDLAEDGLSEAQFIFALLP